jgi:hypothetical protein
MTTFTISAARSANCAIAARIGALRAARRGEAGWGSGMAFKLPRNSNS